LHVSCNGFAKESTTFVDISAKQNLPQSRTKLVGFILSPAWCNTEMVVGGGEYSDRSEHLACLVTLKQQNTNTLHIQKCFIALAIAYDTEVQKVIVLMAEQSA
jgi:hypothetical protein